MAEGGLKDLLEQRRAILKRIEGIKDDLTLINMGIDEICAATFQEKRNRTGKEYGALNAKIEGYEVKQTIGKDVKWDQSRLNDIAIRIAEHDDDPEQWMEKNWKVKEKEFKGWSEEIRRVFLPARTIKPKAPKYDFKELQNDEKENA